MKTKLEFAIRAAWYALRVVVFAGAFIGLSASSYADILVDGDFEAAAPGAPAGGTTYFNSGSSIDGGPWIVTLGTVGVDTENDYVYDGDNSVFLDGSAAGTGRGPDSLTQTLTTTPGQTYEVGFWANADVSNAFSVTFGGLPVAGAPTSITENGFTSSIWLGNSALFTYYSGTTTALSNTADLVFTASCFPSAIAVTVEIDDVSVLAVPEPSTFVLAGIGVLLAVASSARRRH